MTLYKIKYYFIGLTICFCHFISFGQQSKIDSLQNRLQIAKDDTTCLRLFLDLGEICEIKDNLKYAEPAIQLADKLLAKATNNKVRKLILKQKAKAYDYFSAYYDDKSDTTKMVEVRAKQLSIYEEIKDTVNIVNTLGFFSAYYSTTGNMPKALEFCQKALAAAQKYNYKKGIALSYGRMGNIYREQSDNIAALEFFKKRLSILYELRDTTLLIMVLPQTGRLYSDMHNVVSALDCFNKTILLAEASKKDKREIRYLYNCISEMYQDNKNYPRALEFIQKTISQSEEWGDKDWIAGKYRNIGTIYRLQGDFTKALEYQNRSLQLLEAMENESGVMWANLDLAITYKDQKNYKKAKYHCEKAYERLKKGFDVRSICNVERLSGKIDSALGNYKEAFYHYQQYITLRDKLNSEEVRKAVTKEKFQSEYDKQKAMDKVEQDKKDIVAKNEIQRQKILRNSFVGGFLLMLVIGIIVFRGYRQKQKANIEISKQKHIIEEKNKEVEEKNKDILDSIRYAKRIQTSLLPTEKYIERILNKHDKSTGA